MSEEAKMMTTTQAALMTHVSMMYSAWMRHEEIMRQEAAGFDHIAWAASQMDIIRDAIPDLHRLALGVVNDDHSA